MVLVQVVHNVSSYNINAYCKLLQYYLAISSIYVGQMPSALALKNMLHCYFRDSSFVSEDLYVCQKGVFFFG